ncbi:MAG: GNAT family N-acetyltransferase [Comamonadaceae bacterium SCN 68-20]|nr:GNAT family N-acetyltransferase [Comamonadaceae bacterium]ODU60114.1 MAG: GNAT family N-acetyltransferase [Comamonadaceae bacterium SCN 68-20]OJX05410.1 MAG: GNAT family N-acetyltransferase [Burkholderiales bacterium 68-20]
MKLAAPQPLTAAHGRQGFDCGEPALNEWLQRRALASHLSGASRTFVVVDGNNAVRGYYALAAGAVAHQAATGAVRRNMPGPVPVMVLARLAVDRHAQSMQLGGALLQDAVARTLGVAHNAGVRALLVHALHERARQFYEHYGFQASPQNPLLLMLRLQGVASH